MSANMMDYLRGLTTHKDASVREAAEKCLAMYPTAMWKSRTMRKYLSNLSWALYEYIKSTK
jgi:hypothetical protein